MAGYPINERKKYLGWPSLEFLAVESIALDFKAAVMCVGEDVDRIVAIACLV